ncbi:MAG: diguanylate cyclase [Mycobacterium sp.]|nr:hypothetical protein [Mycobacterium sp.]MDT5131323.1 diguanylate cyclase [Mycobacterium sp.]
MESGDHHPRLVAQRVVASFEEPFVIDGQDLLIRPSVGFTLASADDHDASADELLKQADLAMYSAKRARTGGVHTFTRDMHIYDRSTAGIASISPARPIRG